MLLRPVRSSRPGTMPAGLVLVIVTIALAAAAVLNADAIHRRSVGKVDNPQWRVNVSGALASFSDTLRLNSPRQAIDSALGRQVGQRDREPLVPLPDFSQDTGPTPVELRTPTAEAPLRAHIVGDSLAGDVGGELQRVAAGTGLVTAELTYEVSSGLSRPDFVDWPRRLVEDLLPNHDPEVVIVVFGANDMQNMVDAQDAPIELGTQEWLDEYRQRTSDAMDLLYDEEGGRLVVWLGLPVVGPGSGLDQRVVDQVNHIYWSEADERGWVDFVDSWSLFVDDEGAYTDRLAMADGERREVRDLDGIHFTMAGAERLAWAVLAHVADHAEIGHAVEPPASQVAPDEITERDELPEVGPIRDS